MITFFTVPKPFAGHIGTIQRNAIESWTRTHQEARVLLLADEDGTAAVAAELGVVHVPELARNTWGTPLLSDAFAQADQHAETNLLCFVNADVVLLDDFIPALLRVAAEGRPFLVVGESWNADLSAPIDFDTGWQARLRRLPTRKRGADAIDYFAFNRGLYEGMPPFAVGRTAFDNWLIWRARDRNALVVDASAVVKTLHQEHDYRHAGSLSEIRASPEARRNQELAGGKQRLYSRFDATHRLTRRELVVNLGAPLRWKERARRASYKLRQQLLRRTRVTRLVFVLQEPTPYRSPHLARMAAEPGLDVKVVYAARTVQRRTWSSVDERATYLTGPSLPLARILHHDYPVTPGVWPLLSRLRPDVVAIAGWSTSATQLALLWCRVHRTPYLLMSDNHLREPRPGWVSALKRIVLPRVVPQAAGWLVPGSLAREHMLAYGADPQRIVEFPLTVDVPALIRRADELRHRRAELRSSFEIAEDAVAILSVGRLIELKMPDLLVQAVARAGALVDSPLQLVLAGDGPLEPEVRAVARREGVNVTLTGLLEGEKLHELYAAADVFALLSRRELWAVVVNEAMCFGLPLVLSEAVGSAADLLEPGGNGFSVPPGDVDAAAEAIARLAREPVTRESLGRRSRELIEPWGYDRGATELMTLVRSITDARRRR